MHTETMSLQEMCDYSVRQIVAQGGQCIDPHTQLCTYGDTAGRHCAIGWLLDPENVDLMRFQGSIGRLLVEERYARYAEAIPLAIRAHIGIFSALQSFHDEMNNIRRADLREELSAVHGIDTSGDHWQQWVDMAPFKE